jgi:adenosine deaminase
MDTNIFFLIQLLKVDQKLAYNLIDKGLPLNFDNDLMNFSLIHQLAENHMHSGSAFSASFLWPEFLYQILRNSRYILKHAGRYKKLYHNITEQDLVYYSLQALLIRYLLFSYTVNKLDDFDNADIYVFLKTRFFDKRNYLKWKSWILEKFDQLSIFYCKDIKDLFSYKSENCLLYRSLKFIDQSRDRKLTLFDKFNELFWHYIKIKNLYYSYLVQNNYVRGLRFFRSVFFESAKLFKSFRHHYFKNLHDMLAYLDPNLLIHKFEIRSSIDKQDLYKLFKGIVNNKQSSQRSVNVGIVAHFIKASDEHRMDYKRQASKIYKDFHLLYTYLKRYIQNELCHPYIVGIDVAGEEANLPNWLYLVPFYCLRRWWNRNTNLSKLGYTFHAGEDFLDIYQGFRHVYEILRFFPFREGDRIGHGLVLGIDISDFLSFYPPLPAEEYLDNLLWERLLYTEGHLSLPSNNLLLQLDAEIERIAYKIFGEKSKNLSISTLLEFYQIKFDPYTLCTLGIFPEQYLYIFNINKNCYNKPFYDYAKELFKDFIFNSDIRSNAISIVDRRILTNEKKEQKRLENIQQFLQKQVKNQGIIVEVCPTSNIYVGGLHGYAGLPLLKMIETDIKICINTDNPLTFATNLEYEYITTYKLLLTRYNSGKVDNIIKRIVSIGLDASFVQAL